MLEIVPFVLGPVETNSYLVGDPRQGEAIVIDPAWDGHLVAAEARKRGWSIRGLWLTHAHFDHLGGVAAVVKAVEQAGDPLPVVALHPADLPLWRAQGGAPLFGMRIDPGPEPSMRLEHGQALSLGDFQFEVRHAPGHTPGHVVFYCPQERIVFCGDVIFYSGIGRTDLPGGNFAALMESIRTQILSLPDDTRLLSGHGPMTTVGQEREGNPFLDASFSLND
jgi:glyoxylase-like metal-dependent hydrolase (beta-lactamase superfamily II)